jgi:DNA-binding CsgD family transcriptional regulator
MHVREHAVKKMWNSPAIEKAFADAAVEPALWVKAMDTIAEETDSVGAILISVRGRITNSPVSESIQKSTAAYFRDGWHTRDERFRSLPIMAKRGVADDFDFTTPEEMKRHPYYQEFLRPFGLQYFAGVKMAAGDDLWCLSIQRSLERGPFSATEKQKLAVLSRQLSSAAAMARALGFATAAAAVEAFEVSGSAVALLDRRGEVIRPNRAAEALLCPELRIVERRIVSRDRKASAALDRSLHALLLAETPSALMPPVLLPRCARRPILAYPIKLSTVSASVFADCQALLVFIDMEKRIVPPHEVLLSSFALTAAETRLATRMASGEALEGVADELDISKETARSQLKAVFEKTGVHRQAELVALLASFLRQH